MSAAPTARPLLLPKVVSLFTANAAAYVLIGLSYLLYSRLLTPPQFGLYAAALVIGNLGQQLLDAGIRNTIIRSEQTLSDDQQGTLLSIMLIGSLGLVAAIGLAGGQLARLVPFVRGAGYPFLASFSAVYLLSYPLIAFPTARLERALRYERLAWLESAGLVVEKVLPAILLILGAGMMSFVWALAAGRGFRIAVLSASSWLGPCLPTPSRVRRAVVHLLEGTWFRAGVAASLLRDSLHVLLVGPLFGAAWVGYYGWALQLSVIASQAFVQISARISLPVFAQTPDPGDRWRDCLRQTGMLAAMTGPTLAAALVAAPTVNVMLFHSRWGPAIGLLPLLFLRMLPGIAVTLTSNLLLVDRGARSYARAMFLWTLLELLAVGPCIALTGAAGLALSYAVVGWIALTLLLLPLHNYGPARWRELLRTLILRPSILVSCAGAAALTPFQAWLIASTRGRLLALAAAALLVLVAYVVEPELRRVPPSVIALLRASSRRPSQGLA